MKNEEEKDLTQKEWFELLEKNFSKLSLPFYPTVKGERGILFDFCYGVRVFIPQGLNNKFNLKIVDLDNYVVVYECVLEGGDYFVSQKKYFINYGIEITENPTGKKVIQHKFCAKNKDVLIDVPVDTLGDTLAWFNSINDFNEEHQCNLSVRIADYIRPLLEPMYKDICFVSNHEKKSLSPYASYRIGIFHEDDDFQHTPTDYRTVPLHHYASEILGTEPSDKHPQLFYHKDRVIDEPYVCIASQASGGVKLWHNPMGWKEVIDYLKNLGYRVIDIDRDYIIGANIVYNRIPREAEDFTGNEPLINRANLIANADFFIGLGSGLSWLSWCLDKPTVLIGGFSEPWEEFPTPYRVINKNVCHGCFNDVKCRFNHDEFLWCPRHKGTAKHWECSKKITSKSVINKINLIPEFQQFTNKQGE